MIRIKAIPAKGFRRCGKHHPADWVEHPDGTFTPEQIKRLQAEKNLVVVIQPDPPAKEKK